MENEENTLNDEEEFEYEEKDEMISKNKYWEIIKRINWAENTDCDPNDIYQNLKSLCMEFNVSLDDVEDRTSKFASSLLDLVRDAKLNQWTVKLNMPSDDGMDDCISHIIGLGKEEYLSCVMDKQKIVDRYNKCEYVEGFDYIFQGEEEEL